MTRRGPLHPTPDAMTRPEAADERPAAAGIGSPPTDGGDRIDVATWSGSVPAATGVSPGSGWAAGGSTVTPGPTQARTASRRRDGIAGLGERAVSDGLGGARPEEHGAENPSTAESSLAQALPYNGYRSVVVRGIPGQDTRQRR
jgi:hypothetical protein